MTTHTPLPELTNELLGDLLDPSVGPIDICVKYTLSIFQVQALVRTEEFKALRDAVVEIAEARFSLQLPRARQTALEQLTKITAVDPVTPRHAETVRKAVGMILRWKPAPVREDAPAKPAQQPVDEGPVPPTASAPRTPAGVHPRRDTPPHAHEQPGHAPPSPIVAAADRSTPADAVCMSP